MSDPVKQAWQEVGDGFSSLRRLMADRYGASDAGSNASDPEPDRSEVAFRTALESMIAAAREFGERAADIVRDPEVKEQTKNAIGSLNAALTATADQVGDDLRGLLKRAGATGGADTSPADTTGSAESPDAAPHD